MRARRRPNAVGRAIAAGFLVALSAVPQANAETTPDDLAVTRSLVGSYLAGRFARNQHDTTSAADFYRNALTRDPENELLLEQAFQMEASRGDYTRALDLARNLVNVQPQHRIANLFLALNEFKSANYDKAEERFLAAGSGPIGELTSALALAWVKQAEGHSGAALELIKMPKQAEWAQLYLRYHRALISDLADRPDEAKSAYEATFRQDSRTLRTALAYARHAAYIGDRKLAKTILKEHIEKSQGEGHPLIRGLKDDIDKNRKVALMVSTPSEGLAEVFYGLGDALVGESAISVGILYLQLALYIEPTNQFALASLANAHEANKQYAEAIAVYERIPKDSLLASAVEIRKAYNLNSLDKVDEARDTLKALLEKATNAPQAANDDTSESAEDADDGDAVLRVGARGARVSQLQEALKGLGYDISTVDGSFGDGTRRAVMKFQGRNGIKADGLAGPKTQAAILKAAHIENASTTTAAKSTDTATGSETRDNPPLALTVNDRLEVLDALGSIMRSRKMYGEAVGYYNQAILLIPKPEKRHWTYFYARGTSYERLKNWPAAEADLQKALELFPDQPLVLNYLGYSWIDQGQNMKEGMAHIERAVAMKPDDGYIVDSLGWAHYKQGNYKEAVRYLERAVEIKPDDPVLNDHLGDALWRVGREREARFQWDQALSLKPEPEDLDRIKKKLEQGLSSAPEAAAAKTKQASQNTAQPKR